MSLFLGTAREIITPKIGACLYGYKPDWHSTSVADDLTAIAFYFKSEKKEALWISVTVCLLNTELMNDLRKNISDKTGVPFENIIISATHTHSGPNTSGEYGWGGIDEEYCNEIFIPSLLKVSSDAMLFPVEVEMGIGIGDSDIGVNRREFFEDGKTYLGQNPWGCYNPQMTVIAFRDKEHKPVANMVHYGMHGTCAGSNYEISRDWSGVMCDMLEKDSKALTAFVTGPEGDVGPRLSNGHTTGARDISYVYEIGNKAALDAVKIYKSIKVYNKSPRLDVAEREISIPLKDRYTKEFAQNMLDTYYAGKTVNLEGRMRMFFEKVIDSYNIDFVAKKTREVPHNFLILGDLAIVTFPYEMFSEIGLRIAKFSPFPYTLSLACTNGSKSYFVTESEICRGGYEINSFLYKDIQPFVDNADYYLIKNTLDDLKSLYEED